VVADVGQAGTGDKADISGAEDRHTHVRRLIFLEKAIGRLPDGQGAVKAALSKA
jgi:hypothetical protein